ncbi:MAG TPA: outer membrane protein transport protein [Flavobacterium sp.]|nr:outer membrane protein transport protein [Flavobacterium sp.]
MKKIILQFGLVLFSTFAFSQAGHIMQGVGAFNMSMGGASTAQPLDISGALQWNPASISVFDDKIIKLDAGLFFSSPELSSSLPAGMMGAGSPAVSGVTKDARDPSIMPALAMVWGKEGCKHTFGVSAFGISGFGVTFPEELNQPMSASFDPTKNSNPINYPQQAGGFGRIKSDYMLLQIGLTWAYEITDKLSVGVEPTFNYGTLQLMPNPTANPSMTAGYPSTDKATTSGFGAQLGLYYDTKMGFKAGVSYKTTQNLSDMEFENTYLDNTTSTNKFDMDYPSILSFGVGYSKSDFDLALDYRMVDYKNTNGFSETGWTETASVKGFGWDNVSILSAGIQYKGIDKLPLRLGYTYSSNPIGNDVTFFNIPATAIIKNAFQLGFSYAASNNISLDAVYHHGASDGKTSGQMLNPMMVSESNPYGAVPGTTVAYEMTTDLVMIGISYKFDKKEVK